METNIVNIRETSDYVNQVGDTLKQISIHEVDKVVNLIWACYQCNQTIFTCGNGGSGATASHFTGDIIKGLSLNNQKRFKSICLNDTLPGLMAIANDISYSDIFCESLKNFATANDILIAFSGSGNSPNVINAIDYANSCGAITIAICGFDGGHIKTTAQHAIHVPVQDMEIAEDSHIVIVHAIKKA